MGELIRLLRFLPYNPAAVETSLFHFIDQNPRETLRLENYTFLTSTASVVRTNVYATPKSPILRGFSNNVGPD
jgi:hypothetical protein